MKTVILFLLINCCHTLLSQKMPVDYYEEGSEYFKQKNNEKAISSFQYIIDHFPNNEYYPKSLYNIGFIYYSQKNYNKSIDLFKRILELNFIEEEADWESSIDWLYTNCKNRASSILCDIYYNLGIYDSSLYYLSLSDTLFYYSTFCGNGIAINSVLLALKYSDIYRKLNQPEKAISALLDVAFMYLADNAQVIAELKVLLKDKKDLKKELDKSLETIIPVKVEKEKESFTWYYFKFLNNDIRIPYINDKHRKVFDKELLMKIIKDSDFYKMIESL